MYGFAEVSKNLSRYRKIILDNRNIYVVQT